MLAAQASVSEKKGSLALPSYTYRGTTFFAARGNVDDVDEGPRMGILSGGSSVSVVKPKMLVRPSGAKRRGGLLTVGTIHCYTFMWVDTRLDSVARELVEKMIIIDAVAT